MTIPTCDLREISQFMLPSRANVICFCLLKFTV